MIIDEVEITVEAGKGGNGHVSFRREKYVPRGGPDGGDGGKGGNIYFRANSSLNTLTNYASKKNYLSQNGLPGSTSQKNGKNGQDLILEVPPGTIISNTQNGQVIADLQDSALKRIAKGGRGGWGNVHFKSSTNQTPQEFNPGQEGEKFVLKLELKLIADVGLIGYPNAGKSTLLSRVSQARPKIADYPFTTLEPNLGVAKYQEHYFVLADIPGLIAGASQGKGLGHKFLKHIERTKILAHLIDVNEPDITHCYSVIRNELDAYSKTLSQKKELLVLTKIDTITPAKRRDLLKQIKKDLPGKQVNLLSAVSGEGIDDFLKTVVQNLSTDSR